MVLTGPSATGAEDEVRTSDPLLGNSFTTVSHRLRMTIALSLI